MRTFPSGRSVLGIPYEYGMDMWSAICTIFELYTGKILFSGNSNNQVKSRTNKPGHSTAPFLIQIDAQSNQINCLVLIVFMQSMLMFFLVYIISTINLNVFKIEKLSKTRKLT